MICPVAARIQEKRKLILERVYPGKGKPAVKAGQTVSEATIIAHCEVSAGQRLIKIAHVLGVPGSQAKNYLTRRVGERIYEGEVVARKKNLFGLGKNEVKSPVDGLIEEIDGRGDVILQFLPKPVRLIAGAAGKIEEISEDKITLSTIATRVRGFVSAGLDREGIISVAADPKDFILPATIKGDSKGKILVGGALLERSALEKAVTLGVRGIVVGGVNYRDFATLSGGDIGVTVMVTEGFGTLPMGEDIWQFFKKIEGRVGFVFGQENQLIVPEMDGSVVSEPAESTPWRELNVGDKVRFFREESSDLLGVVKELPGEQLLNSGVLAEVALIAFASGEEILLPSANLCIIEYKNNP